MREPQALSLSSLLFRSLLWLYPPAFRRRFADEMAQVFHSLARDAYAASGLSSLSLLWLSTFADWVRSVLFQWWVYFFKPRGSVMDAVQTVDKGYLRPMSAAQAALAALPFLAFGLARLASISIQFELGQLDPFTIFIGITLVVLAGGVWLGFPRWAYSYLAAGFFFAMWWAGVLLPFLAALLLPLLLRRSIQPLRTMLAGLWDDWTLLSFSIYAFYGYVYIIYDSNHHPYLLAFIAATALSLSLGAWGYFRFGPPLLRILALVAGLFLTILLERVSFATGGAQAYSGWSQPMENYNLVGLLFFLALAAVMLLNGLLARWRQQRRLPR